VENVELLGRVADFEEALLDPAEERTLEDVLV
jgi:hypothetical protein